MAHIHSEDQYDFTASAVIVHDDKVLLLFHKKQQMWLNPGGHIELDENITEALYREIEEETGLKKEDIKLIEPYGENLERNPATNKAQPVPFDIDIHVIKPSAHRHIDLAYVLVSKTADIKLEEEGATDIKWFSIKELEEMPGMEELMLNRARFAINYVRRMAE